MSIQDFIDKLNRNCKYRVSTVYIDKLLHDLSQEKELLRKEIFTLTYIDVDDKIALLKHLYLMGYEINDISSLRLMELYKQSGNELIFKLAKYYKALQRHEEIRTLKDGLDVIYDSIVVEGIPGEGYMFYLQPKFLLNDNGTISITKPNLPFTKDEIQQVFWYKYRVLFPSVGDIIKFLQEFKEIIKVSQKHTPFFIQDTTLFFSIISNDLKTDLSMEKKELLEQFESDYLSYQSK